MDNQSESKGDSAFNVGKDFFKPVSATKMIEKDLPDALNEVSDKNSEKLVKFGKAAETVLVKARNSIDDFMKKNPNALAGALLVAGSLVLPTMVGLSIPEVIDMANRHVVANPVGVKDVFTAFMIAESDAWVFNEGIKMMTNNKVDMYKT